MLDYSLLSPRLPASLTVSLIVLASLALTVFVRKKKKRKKKKTFIFKVKIFQNFLSQNISKLYKAAIFILFKSKGSQSVAEAGATYKIIKSMNKIITFFTTLKHIMGILKMITITLNSIIVTMTKIIYDVE